MAELSRCGHPGQNVGVRATTFSLNTPSLGRDSSFSRDSSAVSRPFRSSGGISSVALMSGMISCASTDGFSPRVAGMPSIFLPLLTGNVLPYSRPPSSTARSCGRALNRPSRMFFSRKLRRSSITIICLQCVANSATSSTSTG